MGTDYAFVVMSGNLDGLKYRGSNTYFLPFIIPPYHLEITSWAYIGILIYKPVRGATTSPLNAVYCAPNKLYEYAMYGIPMIGNNVPGLKSSICDNTIGKIFEIMNEDSIIRTINEIERNYELYSSNAISFYQRTDNYNQIRSIVESRDLE